MFKARKNNRPQSSLESSHVQPLESRRLMSAVVLTATPSVEVTPAASGSTVSGLTPAEIRHAYGFDQVTFSNGKVAANGSGQTIAIVDAYNDPDIAADLKTFDTKFSLANPTLSVVSQTGSSKLPGTDGGWAQEISLDVEWAHAIAPAAKILLVEANSSSTSDLLSAVSYARTVGGVSAVSMSFGSSEFGGETSDDSVFTTPSGHVGVTFLAASGDEGSSGGADWPAVSPNVIGVGGTDLYTSGTAGSYSSETGWSDSTGGQSLYEAEPSYQSSVQSIGARTVPDVAYNADPNTGVAVYDSYSYQGSSGWMVFGGTSAAAPQWAGLVAVANQGRTISGSADLYGRTNTLASLYSLWSSSSSTYYHDITSGSTGAVSASTGYDQVTGLGSPKANTLITALVKSTTYLAAGTVGTLPVINNGGGGGGHRHHGGFAVEAVVVESQPVSTASINSADVVMASTPIVLTGYTAQPDTATETAGAPTFVATSYAPVSAFAGSSDQTLSVADSADTTTAAPTSGAPAASSFTTNLLAALPMRSAHLTPMATITGDTFVGRFVQATGWKLAAGAVAAAAVTAVVLKEKEIKKSLFSDTRVLTNSITPLTA